MNVAAPPADNESLPMPKIYTPGPHSPRTVSVGGVNPKPGATGANGAQSPGAGPRGSYGQGPSGPASARSVSGASVLGAQAAGLGAGETAPQRLRRQLDELLDSAEPKIDPKELLGLQAWALDTAQSLFTNQFGDDGWLKDQVGKKQLFFAQHRLDKKATQALDAGRDEATRQADALNVLIRTFRGKDPDDVGLRAAVLSKLGQMGRRFDIDAIMPHVRKATTPEDLYNGLQAVKAITARHGTPMERGGLDKDPVIGPLLQKSSLTPEERRTVIEAVLERGTIVNTKRHEGENRNEVMFLTFAETLPGKDGKREQIKAVWKPEKTWPGKDRAYFSREVAAYEFDKAFAKANVVPPTIEAILNPWGGKDADVGSLQYMIPDAKPLGKNVREYDPRWDGFRKTNEYKVQEARLRTLLFIFNDPDKFANNLHADPNLQNVMIDREMKLWMIDNSYAMGAAPGDLHTDILPGKAEKQVLDAINQTPRAAVADALDPLIGDDAKGVAGRLGRARDELAKRPLRNG